MFDSLLITVFVTLGYLLGTIPTGLLVARWRGVDIRRSGSGNIGATNVLRSVGPVAALVVALVDPLKGVIAVGLPMLLGLDPWIVSATAIATVLGNTFNVFLGFRGGKGIATSLGVFLVIDPFVSVLAVLLFALTLWLTRYVSLASLLAVSGALLMLVARLDADPDIAARAPTLTTALVLALLAFVRHRENVGRLRSGSERRLGEPRDPSAGTTVATTVATTGAPAPDDTSVDDGASAVSPRSTRP